MLRFVLLSMVLVVGCGTSESERRPPDREKDPSGDKNSADATAGADNMVKVDYDAGYETTTFFIDSYEAIVKDGKAYSQRRVDPQVNINFAQAKAACEANGKRLCSTSEWKTACVGPKRYMYGFQKSFDEPDDLKTKCDVARTKNNTPGSLPSKTAKFTECKTEGVRVYDMIGNLTEWTVDSRGNAVASGAAFYQSSWGSSCEATMVDRTQPSQPMPPTESDTDIGFRCCR